MGTNYYAIPRRRIIHIGKSSCGWEFAFQDNDEFHSYAQFEEWMKENVDTGKYVLEDEYDREISSEEMKKIITERENVYGFDGDSFFKKVDGYWFSPREFS